MTGKRAPIDGDEIARRYVSGESENALAEAFGVDRNAIRRRLVERDITIRGRGDAMLLRMSQASPEERRRLASAAHEAARGRKATDAELAARALATERLGGGRNVSVAERNLTNMLRARGLSVTPQKAIGPYNVDIATGTVAVEVLGGSWHRSKRHGKRLRYLINAGWSVVYVWVDARQHPLGSDAAQYIVAHAKLAEGDPAASRGYWVIRGTGEFVAHGGTDGDDIPDVVPISSRPDVRPAVVPAGHCHCGCGGRTFPARRTDASRGWIKGEPLRYITGHNNPYRPD